jgi:hypothetical protein
VYIVAMRSVGLSELFVVLLATAVLYVFPLWRIAQRMGYHGSVGVLACLPGFNVLVAYFIAFSEWPVLRELAVLRRKSSS